DPDVIRAGAPGARQPVLRERAQPAPGTVARHRAAHLSAGRQSVARFRLRVGPWQRLKYQAGHRPFATLPRHLEELAAPLQPLQARHRRLSSRRKALAAPGTAPCNDLAAADSRHAAAEAMAALADKHAGLIRALHVDTPKSKRFAECA